MALCTPSSCAPAPNGYRPVFADIQGRMTHVDRGPLLADLVTAEDVRQA
jgi:hypothetical protein